MATLFITYPSYGYAYIRHTQTADALNVLILGRIRSTKISTHSDSWPKEMIIVVI